MIKEIGSEFSLPVDTDICTNERFQIKSAHTALFCFSGRTAIEIALNDASKHIKKAMLPSYCCDSMIEPFRKNGIEICFYQVEYDEKLNCSLENTEDCDAVLWCDYFGYNVEYPNNILKDFRERNGVVIRDITHSLFCDEIPFDCEADYFVASLRKWGPSISGGLCLKKRGIFSEQLFLKQPCQDFIDLKLNAMRQKTDFLQSGNESKKDIYLRLFRESNEWLANNYSMTKIDNESLRMIGCWNIQEMKNKRRANAHFLHQEFSKMENITLLFENEKMDCPLFVPIILKNKLFRDKLRNELVSRKIYCPIHWPQPNEKCYSNLYDRELSIVCDQRYGIAEMRYIVNVIKEIMDEL